MKTITRLLALIFAALFAVSLTGCTVYKDTNGDEDYTLQTLSENDLIKGRSSSAVSMFSNTVNKTTKVRVKSISGVKEFITIPDGKYKINVSFKVLAGNARLALCDGEKVIKDFEINKDDQSFTFDCGGKTAYLKGAFESARLELEFTLEPEE